jgi:hypothetical protein
MVNRQSVSGDWSVDSDYFQFTATDADTASVNSFGAHEHLEKDEKVWHVNSAAALDLAQRKTQVYGTPYDSLMIEGGLAGLHRFIGETATAVDSTMSIDGAYRIMSIDFDMDKGFIKIGADRTQVFQSFVLNTSSLNGSDVLT